MHQKTPLKARLQAKRSQIGLDWLNFFIADVQTGFGPFVAVYLATQHWTQSEIGYVMALGGVASVVSQMPAGALVDAVSAKRLLIGVSLAIITGCAVTDALWPSFWPVAIAEVLHGSTAGIIRFSMAALALGLCGHRALSGRLGRNQRFNALGTAVTAALMGVVGQIFSPAAPFYITALLCIPAALSLSLIRGGEIDYAAARSASDRANPRQAHRLRDAARNRQLYVFIGGLFLFQVANAALVPLATARTGYEHEGSAELITAAVLVVPQLLTALVAGWVAHRADEWGRKPLMLIGLATASLRAVCFAFAGNAWLLVPIQLFDGLSAAIIGVLTPLVIADLTRGTGRYNLAQGAAGTAIGIGAAVSMAGSGYLVQHFGYTAGFLTLGAIAACGIVVLWLLLAETKSSEFAKYAAQQARA
ncbi:MAG TPA: MFS transporter [Alphaproteobacteria bacterium]